MSFAENELTFKWTTNISDIKKSEWEKIYNEDIFNSYAFFKAMNLSNFENVIFSYLVIYERKEIVCIVPCFTYLLDFYHIASNDSVRKAVNCVRIFFSGFLRIKTFIVGSYTSTCEHHIGISKNICHEKILEIRAIINQEIKKRSHEEQASLTLIKEVKDSDIDKIKRLFDPDIFFFEEYPKAFIPINDYLGSYPSSLKKKHRKTYIKSVAKFEHLYKWEIVEDYENLIPTIYSLYKNVFIKSKTKFELLNEEYFRNLKNNLLGRTFCLIAKNNQDEIRLIEILLEDKDKLIPFYLGIDYSDKDATTLYLNNIYRVVKEAEARKKDIVELGQTAYYPKIMSGALVERMYLGFYSHNRIWKFLIKHIFKYVFTPVETYSNVYLESYKNIVEKHCATMGYKIFN